MPFLGCVKRLRAWVFHILLYFSFSGLCKSSVLLRALSVLWPPARTSQTNPKPCPRLRAGTGVSPAECCVSPLPSRGHPHPSQTGDFLLWGLEVPPGHSLCPCAPCAWRPLPEQGLGGFLVELLRASLDCSKGKDCYKLLGVMGDGNRVIFCYSLSLSSPGLWLSMCLLCVQGPGDPA